MTLLPSTSQATVKRKRSRSVYDDNNPSHISLDTGVSIAIPGTLQRRHCNKKPNRGGGVCFQLTLAQWLGRRYGRERINSIALDTNDLVVGKVKQTFPNLQDDRISSWLENLKGWKAGDSPWMDKDAWCDVACAFNITV